MNKFEKLGLSEELLKSINELGFEKPTPIQENIIPVILEGYDVIGQAQTGTGKTLAFSSILLTNLKERKKKPQAYILSPTRELTMQIHEELKKLGKYSSLRFACVHGKYNVHDVFLTNTLHLEHPQGLLSSQQFSP